MASLLNLGRGLIGNKEDKYIEDGLVFWLDGINKGDDPTAWTDLINGISFPYNSGQEIRSDSVYFKGSTGLTSSSSSLNHPLENCQIEVVIDNNSGVVITPNKHHNIAFGFFSNLMIGVAMLNAYTSEGIYRGGFPNKKTSYSMNINNLFYNGVVLYPAGISNYWGIRKQDVYEIGYKDNDYKYVGNIFSIRIYNRQLTNEERLHNLEIDKQRFNIQ